MRLVGSTKLEHDRVARFALHVLVYCTVLQVVGQYEDAIFQKRMRELRRQKDRIQRQKHEKQQVGAMEGHTFKGYMSSTFPSFG